MTVGEHNGEDKKQMSKNIKRNENEEIGLRKRIFQITCQISVACSSERVDCMTPIANRPMYCTDQKTIRCTRVTDAEPGVKRQRQRQRKYMPSTI